RYNQGRRRRAHGQSADRLAGLSDRGGARGICLSRRAASFAVQPQRRVAEVQSARGSGQGAQGRRQVRDARPRPRRSGDRGGGQAHRDARRIRRMARDAGDRRLRLENVRSARLSRLCSSCASAGDDRLRRVAGGRAKVRAPPKPGLLLVATRELRWMQRDGVALILVLLVPVLTFAILTLTFSNAVIRNLRVAIVDADRSATSLVYVQSIASAPGVTVAERSSDMTSAMQAVRSGDAIAVVYIPENFERDLLARKRPQVVSLYNRQYFTPGNNAASGISSAISAATAALPHEAEGGYKPGVLVAEQYVLSNPALNFAQFLLRAILPTVLHVATAITGGYAVGSEFSQRSKRAWMRAAGGRPLVALVGKLMPFFAIFMVMMVVDAAIIHVLYGVSFRGDPLLVAASACLLLIAYLSFGALLVLLTQALPTGLSLIAIFCNPAFGFAGVGFPVTAMGTFPQAWGSILPLRWYLQILFDQAARGLPASNSVRPFMILAGLACLYFAFAWVRLRAIANAPPKREETPVFRLRYR